MKNKLLFLALFLIVNATVVSAQSDSTSRKYRSGMAIYAEFGVLSNNKALRNQLQGLGIKPFENVMGSIVVARRHEGERWFSEGRIILMNSTNYTTDKDVPKAYLGGIGIGMDGGPKLVNTTRWNVLIPLGYDLMLYQLRLKNNRTATLGQVVQNPASFQSVKLNTGNINLHAGVGVDYKMNWFPKVNDKVYLSAKATYHLPILGKRKWKGDDVTISDVPGLNLNQVYLQIGLVVFPKMNGRMWHGMH